jgi:ribose 5-phosphate isomerase B
VRSTLVGRMSTQPDAAARSTPGLDDVPVIARRAAQRALASNGLERAAPEAPAPSGVHASLTASSGVRERSASDGPRSDRAVVAVDALAKVPDGARYLVEPGARITPLAEEEAQRRGIRFVAGGAAQLQPAGTLRLAVASDHGGFRLKCELLGILRELGHRVSDLGPATDAACDYPDFARAVALAVAEGRADLGIVVDGAGIGSAMAANKVPGVLAANCWDERSARNAREHNHANVLTLGAGHLDRVAARAVVVAFLNTAVGAERHARRVDKIRAIETEHARSPRRADTFDPTR